MTCLRPIEIVGGGLAGLGLGIGLRHAGVPVTIFEAGAYPRHRVCGEFIAGLDSNARTLLGLDPCLSDATPQQEMAWFFDASARYQHLPEPALAISRHALDHRLAEVFCTLGGTLRTLTRIDSTEAPPGRVRTTGRSPAKSPWVGLKIHVQNLPLIRGLEMHLGSRAYVGLAQVAPDTVNVCGLFHRGVLGENSPRAISKSGEPDQRQRDAQAVSWFTRSLHRSGLAALAERIHEAEFVAGSFCAVAGLGYHAMKRTGRAVVLGDARELIPPFTGNGMAMALQGAALALAPLVNYSRGLITWEEARCAVDTTLRRRFRSRLTLARALHRVLLADRHRCLSLLQRHHLIPFRSLYTLLH